jgi:antirestriction protein ArdC
MSNAIYQSVTDKIISELERGAVPWLKPWRVDSTADKNFISDKPYQGINRLILGLSSMTAGYDAPIWASYDQWLSKGAQVRKGEKGTHIVFYKQVKTEKINENNESVDSAYSVLKSYTVFNVHQTDMDVKPLIKPVDDAPFNPIPACENTLLNSGAIIQHGGDSAFYARDLDKINLPNKTAFNSPADYYATAFHELIHWSGAPHRLDRIKGKRFGDKNYSFEELIAEIGAAYLCADHKIEGELRHAGYIESWLKVLKDDNKAIFKAAAYSQKAADYIKLLNNNTLEKAA